MLESKFKTDLVREIKTRFPGSIVLHISPNDLPGGPDLLILHKDKWAALEGKQKEKSSHRPRQDYYVDKMNEMSYASFIYPENKEDVLNDMERSFQA